MMCWNVPDFNIRLVLHIVRLMESFFFLPNTPQKSFKLIWREKNSHEITKCVILFKIQPVKAVQCFDFLIQTSSEYLMWRKKNNPLHLNCANIYSASTDE